MSTPLFPDTSRPRRADEVDSQDYHFISRLTFEQDILARKFVEHGEYEKSYYGTSLEAIRSVVTQERICVLNLHPQSLRILKVSKVSTWRAGRRVHSLPFPYRFLIKKYRVGRPICRKVLLCFAMMVARASLGSRQLQYQPISRGNFPKYYLQNLATDRMPRSVCTRLLHPDAFLLPPPLVLQPALLLLDLLQPLQLQPVDLLPLLLLPKLLLPKKLQLLLLGLHLQLPQLWGQLNKNRSSRKIDSQRLFSREKDFPKTLSLTENQFSRKTYFYTIHPLLPLLLLLLQANLLHSRFLRGRRLRPVLAAAPAALVVPRLRVPHGGPLRRDLRLLRLVVVQLALLVLLRCIH